jgi:anti-sigma B factor antagonist
VNAVEEAGDGLAISDRDGVRIVAFRESIDLTAEAAPAYRTALQDGVLGTTSVVLDLGNVGFIDSSGIGTIVVVHRALARLGGELRLAQPSRDASTAFELVRLHRLLEIHPSVDAAVASFSESDA